MFLQPIHVECVSFVEKDQRGWRPQTVEQPTRQPEDVRRELDEKELEAFCRHSLS